MVKQTKSSSSKSNKSKLSSELILFPGYGGVLLGWLSVIGIVVFWLAVKFGAKIEENSTVIIDKSGTTGNDMPQLLTVIISILVMLLLFMAIWIYVSKWTKLAVAKLAKLLKVSAGSYWTYCTILLIVAWALVVGLSYLTSNEDFFISCLFIAAGFIAIGSGSFGLASLRKVAVPSTVRAGSKNTKARKISSKA